MYDLKSWEMLYDIFFVFYYSFFVFDFCFIFLCIVVISFQKGEDNSLSLVQILNWEVFVINLKFDDIRWIFYLMLKDLFYLKDGNLIFVVMVIDGCYCRERKVWCYFFIDISVYIFNLDNV